MATNDIHVTVSDNNPSASLRVSSDAPLRSVNTENGSPYYVGARAYVEQTASGAVITIIDREGTTTATILNGTDGIDGTDGVDGVGITSITQNLDGTLTILLDDGSSYITEPLKGEDGRDGVDGQDGFSPTATVSKVGDTATISITDINGTTTASISDGTDGVDGQDGQDGYTPIKGVDYFDGQDGQDGTDGYSPTATVTKAGDTATISITDINGTTTATVSDGTDGIDGTDGTDGADGNGIVSITKTATVGLVDTYTILFTDGTTTTFNVTNGANGSGSVADVWVDGSSVLDGDTAKIDIIGRGYITSPNVVYCTCGTATSTVAKEATIVSGSLSSLTTGAQAIVKFTYANSATNPTLKVGTTDAKTIKRYGTSAPSTSSAGSWNAGSCILFVYDGTDWQMIGWLNSTYSEISATNIKSGTGSTTGLISGRRAKAAVEEFAPVKSVNGNTGEVTVTVPTNLSDLNNDMDVSDFPNDAGYLTSETDPTVSSWAKEASKPSYTASEISGLIDFFYPVGSYYETSDTTFNPNTAWGGTWSLETEGQVHVSSGANYTVSGALSNVTDGGASTVKLVESEIPAHTHGNKSLTGGFAIRKAGANAHTAISATGICSGPTDTGSGTYSVQPTSTGYAMDRVGIDASHTHSSFGGSDAHENMQPYIVVNRWHRTA